MGKIILVSATPLEHGGLKDINGVPIFQVGIGKTNSAMNMTEIILKEEPDLVVNLDNRYIKLGEEIDTLAAVTARGAVTTDNITTGNITSGTISATNTIDISGTGQLTIPGGSVQGTGSATNVKSGTVGFNINNNKYIYI